MTGLAQRVCYTPWCMTSSGPRSPRIAQPSTGPSWRPAGRRIRSRGDSASAEGHTVHNAGSRDKDGLATADGFPFVAVPNPVALTATRETYVMTLRAIRRFTAEPNVVPAPDRLHLSPNVLQIAWMQADLRYGALSAAASLRRGPRQVQGSRRHHPSAVPHGRTAQP